MASLEAKTITDKPAMPHTAAHLLESISLKGIIEPYKMIKVVDVREAEDVAIVSFKIKITHENIGVLRGDSLSDQIAARTDRKKVILNMGNIYFMDSILLGRVLGLLKTYSEMNGTVAFTNINKEVLELMKGIQLHKIIDIFDTEKDALEKLGH